MLTALQEAWSIIDSIICGRMNHSGSFRVNSRACTINDN